MGTCAFDFNFKCIELMNIYYCHNIYFLTKQSVSVPFFFLTKTMTSRLAMLSWMSSKMSDFFFPFSAIHPTVLQIVLQSTNHLHILLLHEYQCRCGGIVSQGVWVNTPWDILWVFHANFQLRVRGIPPAMTKMN